MHCDVRIVILVQYGASRSTRRLEACTVYGIYHRASAFLTAVSLLQSHGICHAKFVKLSFMTVLQSLRASLVLEACPMLWL